jgi:cobyrinic acid a,c-diamide synthase
MGRRLRRLGYCRAGTVFSGHEFHYSDIDTMPEQVRRVYALDDGRTEGYLLDNTLAGYVHLHWGGNPETAGCFVRAMGAA